MANSVKIAMHHFQTIASLYQRGLIQEDERRELTDYAMFGKKKQDFHLLNQAVENLNLPENEKAKFFREA